MLLHAAALQKRADVLDAAVAKAKEASALRKAECTQAMAKLAVQLEQAADTGILTVKKIHKADFSAHNGLIATCAGSVSPWNTHLGGEEWGVPDSIKWDASTDDAYTSTADLGRDVLSLRHLSLHDDDLATIKAAWSPYKHRWVNEVAIDDSSSTTNPTITATKHYSMGRYSIELPYCIGDTPQVCYITDDSNTGVAAMFIPDAANDLSAGTLYAMKVTQTSTKSVGGGMFDVEWVSLGHATDAPFDHEYVAGDVRVTRASTNNYHGYAWTVTFADCAPGGLNEGDLVPINIPEASVGDDLEVEVSEVRPGARSGGRAEVQVLRIYGDVDASTNETQPVRGFFRLGFDGSAYSPYVSARATAAELAEALEARLSRRLSKGEIRLEEPYYCLEYYCKDRIETSVGKGARRGWEGVAGGVDEVCGGHGGEGWQEHSEVSASEAGDEPACAASGGKWE